MRARFVGGFAVLLGSAAAWKHFSEGAVVFALGLVVLALAGMYYVVRPSRPALGVLELLWGGLVVAYVAGKGATLRFDNAQAAGSSVGSLVAVAFAVMLIIMGARNLIQSRTPRQHPADPSQ